MALIITNGSASGGTPGGADTQVQFNDGGVFGGDADFTWNKTTNTLGLAGANLVGAANVLALRNGTTAQSFQSYNTFTDAANYERFSATWSGNVLTIGTESAGTGTARGMNVNAKGGNLNLQTGDTTRFAIVSTGHLLAANDNTYDIGANGGTRPRNIFVGGYIQLGNAAVAETPTATHTLTIKDSAGTTYKVLCVAA